MKKIFNIQYELLQTYFHCSLFITFNYLTMLFLGCFHRLSGEVTLVIIDIFAISLSQASTLFQFQLSYEKKGMPSYRRPR